MTSPLTSRSQYATALDYLPPSQANMGGSSEDEQLRLRSYLMYEDFYYNRPETFKVLLRGDDNDGMELYVPSARKMIDACNRFLAKNFSYVLNPRRGSDQDRALAEMHIGNLFRRERFYSKFNSQRRYGLIRGDAVWHLTADPRKPQGQRISIHELNPGNYFPIEDPDNEGRLLGCHIVDTVQDPSKPEDRTARVTRRQTYIRQNAVLDKNGGYYVPLGDDPGGWMSSLTFWEIGKWDDRNLKTSDLKPLAHPATIPLFALSPLVTAMPVYHWKNNAPSGAVFGLSEISGVETLIAGINQGLSDENLTLIMQGLGVYATDAAPPKNDDGTDGDWTIGPARVAEVGQGNFFNRVSGVSSVAPYQEHLKALHDHISQSLGIPDIAQGRVDVTVAESGISLALQLGPIIASNQEKEVEILGTHDQMFYDLINMWFPAYEQLTFPDVSLASIVDDPMPVNREARIQEVLLLQASGLITIAQAQAQLAKYGYEFDQGDEVRVVMEAAAIAMAQRGDIDKNRWEQELTPPKKEQAANIGKSSTASASVQGVAAADSATASLNGSAPGA